MQSDDMAVEKYKIQNTNLQTARIGGEALLKLLLVAPPTPSTPSPSAP
jgi:hypothetical protein